MKLSTLSGLALAAALMTTGALAVAQPGDGGRGSARGDGWRMHDDVWGTRDQGWRSRSQGGLTRAERMRIRIAQRQVRQLERMAWADGFLSLRERRLIATAHLRLRRLIVRLRHDVDFGHRRGRGDWGVY